MNEGIETKLEELRREFERKLEGFRNEFEVSVKELEVKVEEFPATHERGLGLAMQSWNADKISMEFEIQKLEAEIQGLRKMMESNN